MAEEKSGNKWAVMGGVALNVEYMRKYGFEASAAAKVTAKLVAVPPPQAFVAAIQASAAAPKLIVEPDQD
jgi:hypothetical protein